jgi:hypothetical protein
MCLLAEAKASAKAAGVLGLAAEAALGTRSSLAPRLVVASTGS